MHYRGKSLDAALPFLILAFIILPGKVILALKIRSQVIIDKDYRRNEASMDCNTGPGQQCVWHLGPIARNLSRNDSPETVQRLMVDKHCSLQLSNLKFEDEGTYECYVEDGPPLVVWELVIHGKPSQPVILFENRTEITDEPVVIEKTPVTIPLLCLSTDAKPKMKGIRFEIDGKKATVQPSVMVAGPVTGPWNATGHFPLTFSETDGAQHVVKKVSCIVEHDTGEKRTTKVFGVRSEDKTVRLLHIKKPNSVRGQLKCSTDYFPWPSKFYIVRIGIAQNYTHHGQELDVREDGRYVCNAADEIERADGRIQDDWLDESSVVVIAAYSSTGSVTASIVVVAVTAAMSAFI